TLRRDSFWSGKELDQEVMAGGNLECLSLFWEYYFGARYYDPEIARFFNVDRFADKYPSLTPYQYAANNPVLFVDVNGDSIWIKYKDKEGKEQKVLYTQGMSAKGYSENAAILITALNLINTDNKGNELVTTLTGSTENYDVKMGTVDSKAAAVYDANEEGGGTITIDPSKTTTHNTTGKFMQLVFGMAHELTHASQHDALGSKYYYDENKTSYEAEAYNTQFGMYTRFLKQYGSTSIGFKYSKSDPIFGSWKTFANTKIVPNERNFHLAIYNTYIRFGFPIKYDGP
ncbi:MAG: hypothetical protein JXB44_16770, partial [Calditrichaceae bacterium]|nr:hypothetical protein [Calditrichaceae bacterium]